MGTFQTEDEEDRHLNLIGFALRLVELVKFETIIFKSPLTGKSFKVVTVDVLTRGLIVSGLDSDEAYISSDLITSETFSRADAVDSVIPVPW